MPSKSSLLAQARAAFPSVSDSLLVTGRGLESVATHFGSMRSKLEAARARLGDGSGENLRVRYGLREAGEALGAIEGRVLSAEARLVREVVPGRPTKHLVAGLAEAQGELRTVAPWAEKAQGELTAVVRMAQGTDVRGAIRDVGAVAQEALLAERELGVVSGQVELLADGASFEPGAEPAAASESLPSSENEAGVGLTEEDLARIGSGLDPSRPAPQILWTEESVNRTCEQGRAQGGVTDAEGQAHLQLAQGLLEGASSPVELGPGDIALLLKEGGVPLETVDPQQLTAAARYASSATTVEEQADRLRKTLDSFQTLARVGAPRLTRQEMVAELWAAAKVPSHALQKLSEADVAKTLQQVRSALNGPPGEQQIKVGSYTLKLAVGSGGTLRSTSCKKPGFFSKLGSVLKKAVPVALTVLSFVPATAVFARLAQGAISLVKAIRAKSVLGAVTSAASIVAGGAAAVASKAAGAAAAAANKVAAVAGGVARSLQGVSSLRQGSVLGGLAAIGSGVAGGLGAVAKGMGDGLSRVSNGLEKVSTQAGAGGPGGVGGGGVSHGEPWCVRGEGGAAASGGDGRPDGDCGGAGAPPAGGEREDERGAGVGGLGGEPGGGRAGGVREAARAGHRDPEGGADAGRGPARGVAGVQRRARDPRPGLRGGRSERAGAGGSRASGHGQGERERSGARGRGEHGGRGPGVPPGEPGRGLSEPELSRTRSAHCGSRGTRATRPRSGRPRRASRRPRRPAKGPSWAASPPASRSSPRPGPSGRSTTTWARSRH